MRTACVLILFAIATVECRKVVPISKNANVDFINMESGGVGPTPNRPVNGPAPVNTVPGSPTPSPAKAPAPQSPKIPEPIKPPVQSPQAPKSPTPVTLKPQLPPNQPKPQPTQLDLKPASKPVPGPSGITTPGPGKVKDLVTFYDSQGKASPIRPYSYSQAVKQG